MARLRVGSRGSQLALWQANHISGLLRQRGHEVQIEIIRTTGDKITDVALAKEHHVAARLPLQVGRHATDRIRRIIAAGCHPRYILTLCLSQSSIEPIRWLLGWVGNNRFESPRR